MTAVLDVGADAVIGASSRSAPAPGDCVIFQPYFVEFGGEERVIVTLAEALHARGRPHCVVCYEDRIGLARHARTPLRVHALAPPGSRLWTRLFALRALLQRLRAPGAPLPALFSIQAALHAGIVALQGTYHLRISDTYRLIDPRQRDDTGWLRQHLTRRGVRRAAGFVTNTVALADEMHALYGRRAAVTYLGGHGEPQSAAVPARAAAPLELLSVSRLQASKRIDWVLRALAQGQAQGGLPRWRLRVVGDGPERQPLQALAASLGLAGQVEFLGFVDDAVLDALYARSHVFLMPAVQGYGLPALEALYRHGSVVMSRESGVAEVLGGTPWVRLAEPGEPAWCEALLAHLRELGRPDGGPWRQPVPELPTMRSWAEQTLAQLAWASPPQPRGDAELAWRHTGSADGWGR
jgi:glycosyltransferase involved in cell wall biosynthesis